MESNQRRVVPFAVRYCAWAPGRRVVSSLIEIGFDERSLWVTCMCHVLRECRLVDYCESW